jgi:SAM-dependent methyltransferase
MKEPSYSDPSKGQSLKAEFDLLADEYHNQHKSNIAITGEDPEYFAEYKIADLATLVKDKSLSSTRILDFGCGIGNSVPFFRKHFASSELSFADVSSRSIEIAQTRFPGPEQYALIDHRIPIEANSQDIAFSACVFHHIPHEEHEHWLSELLRVTRPGGLLVIYEHNPLNPLTLHAVNTCPIDVNAHLIRGNAMKSQTQRAGWIEAQIDYKLFFPSFLKFLRPLEQRLSWLAFGAQYRVTASKPA